MWSSSVTFHDHHCGLVSYGSQRASTRQRAHTFVDMDSHHRLAILGTPPQSSNSTSDLLSPFPRKSPYHSSLQLSIPSRASLLESSSGHSSNESPVTPGSLSSPITGVVDLTKYIKTSSPCAVAQGGLSDIYKGEWYRVDTDDSSNNSVKRERISVAIKLLRVFTKQDQDGVKARKRLNHEVYVWHRLEHPNIVKLFGTSYHMDSRPAMIMQWYDNGSAAEYLAQKNPSANRTLFVLDVARGLTYLHTHDPPIIHGDLKGNNVLITDEGRAVLCDFGLSQVVEELGKPTGYTLTNPDVGPIRWQAPEYLENEDASPELPSDVWSFGCTAFELLTSQIPYAHRGRDALVIKDIQNGIKPPGKDDNLLEKFDPRICNMLDRCWSFLPESRPRMPDVLTQLQAVCND